MKTFKSYSSGLNRNAATILLMLFLGGCNSIPHVQQARLTPRFKLGPVDAQTKIFLVAGSHSVANFAEEIVEQKRFWISRGVRPNEIACYYAIPCEHSIHGDHAQFQSALPELENCFPASFKTIQEHVAFVAKQNPRFVYFYFTGHGKPPISRHIEWLNAKPQNRNEAQKNEVAWLETVKAKSPGMEQYTIDLDCNPSGTPLHSGQSLQAVSAGEPVENYFLTPASLAGLLGKLPSQTKKVVILQACFSGGFVEPDGDEMGSTAPLKKLHNLEVLTASAQNRTSFGCHTGDRLTFFGASYLESLHHFNQKADKLPWKAIYERTKEQVQGIEKSQGITEVAQSLPLYRAFK